MASKVSSLESRNKALENDLKEVKGRLDAERRKKKEKGMAKEY